MMYDYFNGQITALSPTQVTIDCGGVGYSLQISLYTFGSIKGKEKIKLFAHQIVREDAHLLFGFADPEERHMFKELINVTGVGANTARIIQSSLLPDQLKNVILSGDIIALQRVKGIGTKTAQRIILDLQDRMKKSGAMVVNMEIGLHNTIREEALSALLTLGFVRVSAEKAVNQAQKNLGVDTSVEELIKLSLSYL
jgi:holliday junction DNA helicase RuvA